MGTWSLTGTMITVPSVQPGYREAMMAAEFSNWVRLHPFHLRNWLWQSHRTKSSWLTSFASICKVMQVSSRNTNLWSPAKMTLLLNYTRSRWCSNPTARYGHITWGGDVIIVQQAIMLLEEGRSVRVLADDTYVYVLLLYLYQKQSLQSCLIIESPIKDRSVIDLPATVDRQTSSLLC